MRHAQVSLGAGKKAATGRKGPQSEAPWVATGAPADAQYSSARRDARDHMRMRNAFFQQVRILAQQQCTLVIFCVPACC